MIRAERRDELKAWMLDHGVDVKVHYPVPLHLQTVGRSLGYKPGDCPVAERQANEVMTLPMNEYLNESDMDYMSEQIHGFYA